MQPQYPPPPGYVPPLPAKPNRPRWLIALIAGLALCALLGLCGIVGLLTGSPASTHNATATPQPIAAQLATDTPQQPTVPPAVAPTATQAPLPTDTPISVPTARAIVGGFGLPLADWQSLHGTPSDGGIIGNYYEGDKYDVVIGDDGRVFYIGVYLRNKPVTLSQAKSIAHALLPSDARLLREPRKEDTVSGLIYVGEVYKSEFIPDTFNVMYKQFSGDRVEFFSIQHGDFNP